MSELVTIASRQYSWGNCNKDVTQHRIETLVQPNALFSRVLFVAEKTKQNKNTPPSQNVSEMRVYTYRLSRTGLYGPFHTRESHVPAFQRGDFLPANCPK